MIREEFAAGDSIIHRIDPRMKIIAAVGFCFVVALSMRFETLVCALAWAVALFFSARLNWMDVFKRVIVVMGFVLLIWLVLPFTYTGDPMGRIGPFPVVRQGVVLAAQITLKSITILLAFISLVGTMPVSTLGHALSRLRLPNKMVYLLLITYRYFFVIQAEYHRLVRAAKIRGFQPRTSLHAYKTYAYFIGMLFVRASERADRVNKAMRCRGFNGTFHSLCAFPPHPRNAVFSVLMGVSILVLMGVEWARG